MFGLMQGFYQRRAADEARRLNEAQARAHRDAVDRRMRLIGKTFKCGAHRWLVLPKHPTPDGRPMTPEITVAFLER